MRLHSLAVAILLPMTLWVGRPPNVVFILSDDVGVGDIHFSCPASEGVV